MPLFQGTTSDIWWLDETTANGAGYQQWVSPTATTSTLPSITTTSGATNTGSTLFWSVTQARIAQYYHQMAEQGMRLEDIENEWQTIQFNRLTTLAEPKRRKKRAFNGERVRRAEQRARERWHMGDPTVPANHHIRQREAQERAVEQTATLREVQRKKAAEAAAKRAEGLLLSCLTPQQLETYKANKWFVVEGGKSKTKYRVRHADHMVANVDVLKDDGTVSHRLCAHLPIGTVPTSDQLLAQKLMLEGNEDHFLKTANRHRA